MEGEALTLPVRLESLARAREFIRSEAGRASLPEDRIFDLVLATDEACSNLIEHGHIPETTADFSLAFAFDGRIAEVLICDTGLAFDPADRPSLDLSAPEDKEPGGLGWHLIMQSVDAVEYQTGPDGNQLTLKKLREPDPRRRDTVLEIDMDQTTAVTVARVTGTVDSLTAPDLLTAFEQEIDAGSDRMVVDLSGVDYMSSAGLRSLLGAVKKARSAGGDLRLAAPQPNVFRVLDMSGFTGILKCFDDIPAAVESLETT
jgi:anti-sigma B factor antagonist